MVDEQYRRLMRRFNVVLALFVVAIVACLGTLATVLLFSPNAQVHSIAGPKGDPGESITGPAGLPGASIVGPMGPAGRDGQTTVSEKQTVIEKTPERGEKGDIGAPGREVEMQRNPATGDVEWRYSGDSLWQVLLEACELSGSCEVDDGSDTH